MQSLSGAARDAGEIVVFVPTMGYLHEGHASLLREGRKRGDLLVLSIFVNPTQFGAGEDFDSYPRDLERDRQLAADAGADIIFTPRASEMYPAGFQTYVDVERLTLPLCGRSRPGHFRGVTTVVCKLINIVMPHAALFGKKDYQQLAVIRRMVNDLNMNVEIVGMPIVREADGLAMSSRNAYLSTEERRSALCLIRAISAARDAFRNGERSVAALRDRVLKIVSAEPFASIDYTEFCHKDTLEGVARADDTTLLALAVKIGKTRLIDNTILGEE
ncbi:MAG: pantoate--beta-alanine [Geobacteraceae bacterium]|nr:MAG: pantoate--beta-alanine [Geobacteraceae bacterium]